MSRNLSYEEIGGELLKYPRRSVDSGQNDRGQPCSGFTRAYARGRRPAIARVEAGRAAKETDCGEEGQGHDRFANIKGLEDDIEHFNLTKGDGKLMMKIGDERVVIGVEASEAGKTTSERRCTHDNPNHDDERRSGQFEQTTKQNKERERQHYTYCIDCNPCVHCNDPGGRHRGSEVNMHVCRPGT